MRLKRLKNLLKILSLFAFMVAIFFGGMACGARGPVVTTAVSDPAAGGMQTKFRDGTKALVPYIQTENWQCFPPNDFADAIEWYKREIEYWRQRACN